MLWTLFVIFINYTHSHKLKWTSLFVTFSPSTAVMRSKTKANFQNLKCPSSEEANLSRITCTFFLILGSISSTIFCTLVWFPFLPSSASLSPSKRALSPPIYWGKPTTLERWRNSWTTIDRPFGCPIGQVAGEPMQGGGAWSVPFRW